MNVAFHPASQPSGVVRIQLYVLMAVLLGVVFPATAREPLASHPSVEDIVNQLTRSDDKPLARSLVPSTGGPDEARGISVEGQRVPVPVSPSIDLDVHFEYASAALTPDAMIILDTLGKALANPKLNSSHFLVEGIPMPSGLMLTI